MDAPRRGPFSIAVTGYRMASVLLVVGFGLGKYFTAANGQSILSNGLDVGYGVAATVVMMCLGYWREDRGPGHGQWFFEKDWGYSIFVALLSLVIIMVSFVLSALSLGIHPPLAESSIGFLILDVASGFAAAFIAVAFYATAYRLLATSNFWGQILSPSFVRGRKQWKIPYASFLGIIVAGFFVMTLISAKATFDTVRDRSEGDSILTCLYIGFKDGITYMGKGGAIALVGFISVVFTLGLLGLGNASAAAAEGRPQT